MRIKSTEIVDTFAEAFEMWGTRMIITADAPADSMRTETCPGEWP